LKQVKTNKYFSCVALCGSCVALCGSCVALCGYCVALCGSYGSY